MTRVDVRRCVLALAVLTSPGLLVAQSEQVRERDPQWAAPSQEAGRSNPLPDDANIVAGGRKLYRQRCPSCHGADARGTSRAPSLIANDVQAQTDGALFWKITGGNAHGGMPSFSFLPEPQRWQLVLHLRRIAVTPSR